MFVEDRTYDRLIATAKVEQILSNARIYIDIDKLRASVMSGSRDKDTYRFMKKAVEGDGYIQCEWFGRDKRTYRLYPCSGELPLTNVSTPAILNSIRSRYDNGKIVCIDYSNHEYRIFTQLFGIADQLPEDIHTWLSEKLDILRQDCKVINYKTIYGSDDDCKKTFGELYELYNRMDVHEYLQMILIMRKEISKYIKENIEGFQNYGFVYNSYGRKIYPKNETSIFNNFIQSIGSEILIDSILKLNDEQTIDCGWNILFQRFDSIYFDFNRWAIDDDLNKVFDIMIRQHDNMELSAKISVGESVGNLKDYK